MPNTPGVIGDATTAGHGTYDVLVVGAGPGGLATALSAARNGARVLVVDRRPGTSGLPRATGINVRTVEILRTWGVAPAVRAHRVRVVPEAASASTLAAPPRSSGRAGGYPSHREILDVSPVLPFSCPQDRLEPVLVDAVRRAGGEIRFGTPLVALHVRPDGVRADLGSGIRVHARFVVGADGTRSAVRTALGIATTHLGTWAHAVQVLFRPDATLRPDPPLLLTLVDEPHPGALCPMGEGRWAYVGLRFDGTRPDVPDDWTATLRAATGSSDLAPKVLDVQRFTLAAEVATTYRAGPGFLVGDAAHRTTPVAGIGLNTAIHDGHELGWKLAWAARGLAGDALLASHDAERAPVGLAAAARSLDVEGRPTDGLPSSLGHTHRSPVIAGTDPVPDLRIDLAARPGERAPHVWVRHAGRHRSTLDLFDGGLTLLTAADGRPWARAAAAVGDVPLRVLVDGRDAHGATLAQRYALSPGSAVLVRPDGRVAWRHDGACADRTSALTGAVATALGTAPPRARRSRTAA
jgi:2-polyprenyl-6-methoxyphenol hydroxylase-like FAD-dependent oxidoreductase